MYLGKFNLMNYITGWRSCTGVPRGCVYRIRLWPLWPDDHSGVLIVAGGTRRSDWPARVLANNVSKRIDRNLLAKSDRLHVCRDKWQLAATPPTVINHGPETVIR